MDFLIIIISNIIFKIISVYRKKKRWSIIQITDKKKTNKKYINSVGKTLKILKKILTSSEVTKQLGDKCQIVVNK